MTAPPKQYHYRGHTITVYPTEWGDLYETRGPGGTVPADGGDQFTLWAAKRAIDRGCAGHEEVAA